MNYRERIREAEAALKQARKTQESLNRERWAEQRRAEQRVEEEFKPRGAAATATAAEARRVLAVLRVEWAKSNERTPYDLGTKVRQWRYNYGSEDYVEGKATGVLEVVTEATKLAGNARNKAAVGDLIVRLHKAGGALGLRYERIVPAMEPRLGQIWRPCK